VARWQADASMSVADDAQPATKPILEMDRHLVTLEISGNIWKLLVELGKNVEAGDPLVIIEAMKTEITMAATVAGNVRAVHCKHGRPVSVGDPLMAFTVAE